MKIKNGDLVFKKKKTRINEFSHNVQVVQVKLANRVKVISRMSFTGCRNLKTVEFNEKLQKIEYGAFMNCSSLEEIIIPASINVLGENAFKDCTNLKKVILPPLKVLPKNLFKCCFNLEEIVIPDTVEVIEEGCFHSCTNLKRVVFSENLKEIKANAFKRCQNLESVVFPTSLKKIGHKAFEDSKNLKFVKFNSDLEYIGKSVFHNKVYDEYKIKGTAFCSSFTSKENIGNCITINIPKTVDYLALGFEGVLPFAYRDRNKTCPNHVLQFEKEQVKVFMSSAYYSYQDDEDYIIKNGYLDEFARFLKEESGQVFDFTPTQNDHKVITCKINNYEVPFLSIISTGTTSLELLFYWTKRMKEASVKFVFIDEFDAFYHFDLSINVCKTLFKEDFQVFMSSHNTMLLSNDFIRPDCGFIIGNNKIDAISNLTSRGELRQGHNIEKMYRAGSFDIK